jgi:uncharacterized lipoprotein YehR (DUF1307 family)
MNPKTFLIILIISLTLLGMAFVIQCSSMSKNSIIIKQNNKEIIAKKYKTHLSPSKDLKSFKCKIDSSLWRYPQNKILYDGILIKAKHDPHEVVLRISKQEVKNGVTYKVTTNKDVSEYFSCRQVDEFEKNIGKRMVITKVFFPRERIFYKFP